MAECDGYFEAYNIPFDAGFQDEAVFTVRSDPSLTLFEKKELITCWFEATYGLWQGSRFDKRPASAAMSAFLAGTKYASFEELLGDTDDNYELELNAWINSIMQPRSPDTTVLPPVPERQRKDITTGSDRNASGLPAVASTDVSSDDN